MSKMPPPGELGCFDADFAAANAPWWKRLLHGYFRVRVHGLANLPEQPFLAVGNHSGAALIPDTLTWIAAYHSEQRQPPLLTLAHNSMFSHYPARLARWLARFGAIRADHGLALEALQSGFAVQVYPGGDHDACRSFWNRHKIVFAGRTGYVELAQQAGVPIVPVASIGAHETLIILFEGRHLARWLGVDKSMRLKAFPLSMSIPWLIWLGPVPGYFPLPAKIEHSILEPIDPSGSVEAVDEKVREALQDEVNARAARRFGPWIG